MARDPNRIQPTLEALARAWAVVPDWRLGQLVTNLATVVFTDDGEVIFGAKKRDAWPVEEDEWVAIFDAFVASYE